MPCCAGTPVHREQTVRERVARPCNKVPKLALASTDALRAAVADFGTPKVIPPKPILKGIAPLFDSKDAKIRGAAKDLTVELTRWLGPDAVKRDLIDKMRDTMQAEVRDMIGAVKGGARATRLTRQEQANPPADPMDTDDGVGPTRYCSPRQRHAF